ncbi:alpha/beta fold hydrolase, partial [Microbacterium sp. ISL-103]|uniref:alpha/beta fold hydrolase n=1 Tax=Microbacterium sp. ISL-103 TaxID=2819156 RepID=UPI002035212F
MPAPLTLPRISWGDPAADRRALLVHGLGSSAALMWRVGTALADAGWHATAVDLRGHGDAPRALDYSVAAYGADLAATTADGGPWDAVL